METIAKLFFESMHYIKEENYAEATQYLSDPESYDFHRILNWE